MHGVDYDEVYSNASWLTTEAIYIDDAAEHIADHASNDHGVDHSIGHGSVDHIAGHIADHIADHIASDHDIGDHSGATHATSHGTGHDKCSLTTICRKGLILPLWTPIPSDPSVTSGERAGRAIAYGLAMIYIFIGVSIIADKFVTCIELIVTQKRKVKVVSRVTGTETFVQVPIWNETVAHMTLFVLANCAPEILLTAIEISSSNFEAGELGPGTIMGSGAYNLFVITGICCMSVPTGKTLRLHELRIFFVTAFWMIFGYVWVYIIVGQSSVALIEVWEAVVTLCFFPICVVTAYIADKECFGLFDRWKPSHRSTSPEGAPNELSSEGGAQSSIMKERPSSGVEKAQEALERREKRFLTVMAEMKKKHPNKTMAQLRELAELEILKEEPKSRNYYRMEASRRLAGGSVINKEKLREKIAADENLRKKPVDPLLQVISFDPVEYSVMENAGSLNVNVIRDGANLNNSISLHYETRDGTGKDGVDYKKASGTVVFKSNETLQEINIKIIDDDEFNMDTQFYVVISQPQVVLPKGKSLDFDHQIQFQIDGDTAKITKLDDDHGGIFTFDSEECTVDESVGEASIKLVRNSGAKSDVTVPFTISALTAIPGVHYVEPSQKQILFPDGVTEKFIKFKIIDEGQILNKKCEVQITLGEPSWYAMPEAKAKKPGKKVLNKTPSTAKLGQPKLGEIPTTTVTITENPELKRAVEDIANTDMSSLMGSTSWADQFKQALALPSGDDEDDVDGDDDNNIPKKKPWKDYVFHILTIFWKILFAFTPPPGLWQGWPGFFGCLGMIGFLIAIIGDLAKSLGCTVNMKDELTAITLVSLGTSLPDMFASRIAAQREDTADAAIGHITGACACNIFLGIGLAWTIGSMGQVLTKGNPGLAVDPGNLGFVIVLFFACAAVAIFSLLIRRLPPIRGELGGKIIPKCFTACFLWLIWLLYVGLSALDNYCIIKTF